MIRQKKADHYHNRAHPSSSTGPYIQYTQTGYRHPKKVYYSCF